MSIYGVLFATGFFIYGRTGRGVLLGVVAAGMGVVKCWPSLSFARTSATVPGEQEQQPT